MGRKIFVSYKYADSNVKQLTNQGYYYSSHDTVRTYVDVLEDYLKNKSDHVYKGESDGEDLSRLSESTIRDKLYDRIYDSTLTIVMISPGMKEQKEQKYQWIPQEISYSLREQSRINSSGQRITSSTNAMLAIVLPDKSGSYDYFINKCSLCSEHCTIQKTDWLFPIMRDNSFNNNKSVKKSCSMRCSTVYSGEASYITYVRWDDFWEEPESYILKAYYIREHKNDYEIHVQL